MLPSTDAQQLASFEKNVLFYLMGTPFNPTLESNYTEVPSNIRIPSKQKKLMSVKCGGYTEKSFIVKVVLFLLTPLQRQGTIEPELHAKVVNDLSAGNFNKENNPFSCFGIDYLSFIASLKGMYKKYQSVNPQAKSRLLSNYNSIYRGALHAFFSRNNSYNFKWIKPYSELEQSIDEVQLLALKVEKLSSVDEKVYLEFQPIVEALPESLRHGFNVVLVQTLIETKSVDKIAPAVRLFWQICYDYNIPDAFLTFYLHNKDLFTKNRFPFFHIETFEGASLSLKDTENLNDLSIHLKSSMFIGNLNTLIDKKLHPLFLSIKLRELVQDSNLPSIEEYVYFINNNIIPEMKTGEVPNKVLIEINKLPILEAGTITDLHQVMPELISLNGSIHEFLDDLMILVDSQKEDGKHKIQLDRIAQEAAKYANNPLDNLENLQSLKAQRTALINSKPSLSISLEQKTLKSLTVLFADIEAFNGVIIDHQSEDAELRSLLFENEHLRNDLTIEKEKNHKLLSKNFMVSNSVNSVSLPAIELVNLLKGPSVEGVINTINATYNTIILSKKTMRELSSLSDFNRFDMLFSKLNVLASPEYINLYETKGAAACFSLLTKKEIAYQESKTVKNLKVRDFTFEDGVTRDCKAHLRICSGFKDQHTLRVYFKIENKKLYIGLITKHLDVATS